jgi:hypothetical protein
MQTVFLKTLDQIRGFLDEDLDDLSLADEIDAMASEGDEEMKRYLAHVQRAVARYATDVDEIDQLTEDTMRLALQTERATVRGQRVVFACDVAWGQKVADCYDALHQSYGLQRSVSLMRTALPEGKPWA